MQYENKSITEIANCNIRLQMMEHHHNIIPSLRPLPSLPPHRLHLPWSQHWEPWSLPPAGGRGRWVRWEDSRCRLSGSAVLRCQSGPPGYGQTDQRLSPAQWRISITFTTSTTSTYLVNLNPELEILAQPHDVGRVAGPADHPHPHPGGRGRVGHHVGPCRLERNPAINHCIIMWWLDMTGRVSRLFALQYFSHNCQPVWCLIYYYYYHYFMSCNAECNLSLAILPEFPEIKDKTYNVSFIK